MFEVIAVHNKASLWKTEGHMQLQFWKPGHSRLLRSSAKNLLESKRLFVQDWKTKFCVAFRFSCSKKSVRLFLKPPNRGQELKWRNLLLIYKRNNLYLKSSLLTFSGLYGI